MPTDSVNIYLTMTDKASPVLASVGDKTKLLEKETAKLTQGYNALQKANAPLLEQQKKLKTALEQQKKAVAQASSTYREYGDELSRNACESAIAEQERLRTELKNTEQAIKSNQKTYRDYQETIRKGAAGSGAGTTSDTLGSGLFFGQLGQMFGSSLGVLSDSLLNSAIGTPTASLASNILSGVVSGAAIGKIVPGFGTALGAAVGGVSGAFSGISEIFEAKDDAYNDYYNTLYDEVNAATEEGITSGSAIAAGRETDRMSFSKLFGNDPGLAHRFLEGLVDKANNTPFLYDDLTAMSKVLATYGFKPVLGVGEDGHEILDTLQTVGDAGAALGMATADMSAVSTALGRMLSSDKTTLEYLNILNDRGINAVNMLADAHGLTVADTYKAISAGQLRGGDSVEIILAGMREAYSGAMEEQASTFSGLSSTVEGLKQEVDNAAGEGYNTLRSQGLKAEIDAYGGALGAALQDMAEISGENKALLENLADQYRREALGAVLLGEGTTLFEAAEQEKLAAERENYLAAKEKYEAGDTQAGLLMESAKENAEAIATAAYESGEQYSLLADSQTDQIKAIRENTTGLEAATRAYYQSVERSKGSGTMWLEGLAGAAATHAEENRENLDRRIRGGANKHAYGLPRVPYDEYPALLHRDEGVLTAAENRAYRAGRGGRTPTYQITITGNTFTGTGEDMADRLAETIARKLEEAAIMAAPA